MYVQRDIILQKRPESKFCFPHAYVQCISELFCKCKFQVPASNTVGGAVETRKYFSEIWSKYVACHSLEHNSAIMS